MQSRLIFGSVAIFVCFASAWAQEPLFQQTSLRPSSGNSPQVFRDRNPLNFHKIKIIRQAEIPAEEAGVLRTFGVKEGQNIEAGELLGSIDKTDAELMTKIAASEYEAAKKTADNLISIEYAAKAWEVAKADLEASLAANRIEKGTVTKQQLRSQKLQADRSVMQAEMAKEEVLVAKLTALAKYNTYVRAREAIKRRDILAPMNGVVVEKYKHEGEWVQPGESVLKVIQMDRLWVEGPINGEEHTWHRILGRKVKITVTLTGKEANGDKSERVFYGQVDFASPLIDSNEYTIRAEIENVKENGRWILSPGLDAKVEILEEDNFGGGGFGNDNAGF